MSVEQTIICDNPNCGKKIAADESHYEVSFYTKENGAEDDLAYESGVYQYHAACFDEVMRPVLGVDTSVQDQHQEIVAERQAQRDRAAKAAAVEAGEMTWDEAFPDQKPGATDEAAKQQAKKVRTQ